LIAFGATCATTGLWRARGSLENGTFTPVLAAVPAYGQTTLYSCPATGAHAALLRELDGWTKDNGGKISPPESDGRLCATAATLVGWAKGKGSPPASLVASVAAFFGVAEVGLKTLFTTIDNDGRSGEEIAAIGSLALDTAAQWVGDLGAGHIGLATYRLQKGTTAIAVVFAPSRFEMEPVARRLAAGEHATIHGKLLTGYTRPTVMVSDARGLLVATDSKTAEFQAEVVCGQNPGTMLVEIRGEQVIEPRVLAQFPVVCAAEPPVAFAVASEPQGSVDPTAAAKRLFDLANRERTELSLTPLVWNDTIAQVARAAGEALKSQVEGGQGKPVDVVAQLTQAGWASPTILENPSQSTSVAEIQASYMASAVHRSNILNAEITHAGIAVLPAKVGTIQSFVAVQIFLRELAPVDVEATREKLKDAIFQKRTGLKAPALTLNPALTALAQKFADELAKAKGAIATKQEQELTEPIYRKFLNAKLVMGAKAEPLDLIGEVDLKTAGDSLGIGVASGQHPTLGKNTPYLVILIAKKK